MKTQYKGYKVSIKFVGDAVVPVFSFKLYEKRKRFPYFHKLLWEERVHQDTIYDPAVTMDWVISQYMKNLIRWKDVRRDE